MFTKKNVDDMTGVGDIKGKKFGTKKMSKQISSTYSKMSKELGVKEIK